MSIGLGRAGVLRMVDGKPGHLLHWCPACACGHVIDIHAVSCNGHVVGWDGDFERPSIGEPVRHELAGDQVCEYLVRAGVLYYFANCTHAMAGKSVHLPAYPLPT